MKQTVPRPAGSPAWVAALPAAKNAGQLLVVAGDGMDRSSARVSLHERDGSGAWKQLLSVPGFVGRNGLCAGADHREGCGMTPAGVYRFTEAFGVAPDPGCALPYLQVDENACWSGDPDRYYNRMVDLRDVPDLAMDNSEIIARYPEEYRFCLNISFNEEGTPGRGSAIFLHCAGRDPYTAGCVAIPEDAMRLVMRRVREGCAVVIGTAAGLGACVPDASGQNG